MENKPTKEQLEFRKKLVAEVRLLTDKTIYFRHNGYIDVVGDHAHERCDVCALGALVVAGMELHGQLDSLGDDTRVNIERVQQVLGLPDNPQGRYAHNAVQSMTGLSLLDVLTIEAIYEQHPNVMQGLATQKEIAEVIALAYLCAKRTNYNTANRVELILQVLEKSADHPEGKLDWGLSD